jgi:hypothetical protein
MSELHPLLPPCVRGAGFFSELYLAEVLPTLPAWRPGDELVKEHQALRQLFLATGDAGSLLPRVVARALEHLGHRPEAPSGVGRPFLLRGPGGKTLGAALVTAPNAPLDGGSESPQRSLERFLLGKGLSYGILTNGTRWRLLHTPPGAEWSPPYEIEPTELFLAPFFAEPFRYFSLFFRAASFDKFFSEALAGSAAAWMASAQVLVARARGFLADAEERGAGLSALVRALFALLGAARGLPGLAARVTAARRGEEEALRALCEQPSPPGPPALPALVRRALAALSPPDLNDPSGLRDARLPDPLWLPLIVRSAVGDAVPAFPREIARRALTGLGPGSLVDLFDGGGLWLGALALESARSAWANGGQSFPEELRKAARRVAALSSQPWRADLSRLTLILAGADESDIAGRCVVGALSDVSRETIVLPPDSPEPSLFSVAARSRIDSSWENKPAWLLALADAWAGARAGVLVGYETLLSWVTSPQKLLAAPGVRRAQLWAMAHGVRHWGLSFPPEPPALLVCAPPESERPEVFFARAAELLPERASALLVAPVGWSKRHSGAPARAALLRKASLAEVIETEHDEAAILRPAGVSALVRFWRGAPEGVLQSEQEIPEISFREPEGAPWTPLRAAPAVSLAARIRARSYTLEDLLVSGEPGQLYLSGGRLSLQAAPGAAAYRLRVPGLDPAYVLGAAQSALARYVSKIEGEGGVWRAPIPRIHFHSEAARREAERAAILPLLKEGHPGAVWSRAEQLLARGEEDIVHDIFALSARDARETRGGDALRDGLLSRLLGLSEGESALLGQRVTAPEAPPAAASLRRAAPRRSRQHSTTTPRIPSPHAPGWLGTTDPAAHSTPTLRIPSPHAPHAKPNEGPRIPPPQTKPAETSRPQDPTPHLSSKMSPLAPLVPNTETPRLSSSPQTSAARDEISRQSPPPKDGTNAQDLREALLDALRQHGELTSNQAQGATGLDSRRLRLLLAELEEEGLISRSGKGRGTHYHLNT